MKRTGDEMEFPLKKAKLYVETQRHGSESEQNGQNGLSGRLEEMKQEINHLKAQNDVLTKQRESSNVSIGVINRYWNNLDEDLAMILKRLVPMTESTGIEKNVEKVTAKTFLARLFEVYDSTVREDESEKIDGLLKERCDKTKNVLSKVVDAILVERERNEENFNKTKEDKDPLLKRDPVVKMLKEENNSKQKKLDDFTLQVEEFHVVHRQLKNEMNFLKDDLTKAHLKIRDINSELDSTKFEISRLKSDRLKSPVVVAPTTPSATPGDPKVIEDLKREIDARKKAFDDLSTDFIHIRQENSYLVNDVALLKKDLNSEQVVLSSQTYKMIYTRNEQLKYELEQARNIQGQMKMDIIELEKTYVNRLQVHSDKETKKRTPLLDELRKKDVDIGKLISDMDQLKLKISELEANDSKEHLDTLHKLIEEQQTRIKNYQAIVDKKADCNLAKYTTSLEKIVAQKDRVIATLEKELKRKVDVAPAPETDVSVLQEELAAQKEAFDVITQELDDTAAQFFAEQEKNTQLAIKLTGKDDKYLQLVREKMALSKQIVSKDNEIGDYKNKIENLTQITKQMDEMSAIHQQRMNNKEEEFLKQLDELKLSYSQLDKRTRMYNDVLLSYNELKAQYDKLNPSFMEYRKKFDDLEAAHGQDLVKLKKMTIDFDLLAKRVNYKGGDLSQDDDSYKKMVICGICHTRPKDTTITRCGHVFCGECVNECIRVRNRKCPGCALKFGENEVLGIFL